MAKKGLDKVKDDPPIPIGLTLHGQSAKKAALDAAAAEENMEGFLLMMQQSL